jgi:hypothetical protein
VVKLFIITGEPSYLQPWELAPADVGRAGVTSRQLILTNAHVVAHHPRPAPAGTRRNSARVSSIDDTETACSPSTIRSSRAPGPVRRIATAQRERLGLRVPDGGNEPCITAGVVAHRVRTHTHCSATCCAAD